MAPTRRFVFLGLAITSSWGNGHATTYRALVTALARRGHGVTFLERDVPWYRAARDLTAIPGVEIGLYGAASDLEQWRREVLDADCVIVGSYVPEGRQVADWVLGAARGVTGFYDIDTPITLAALEDDACEYLARDQVGRFDLYLSFTGGPALARLRALGARAPRPLYCGVDTDAHAPIEDGAAPSWDLGYLGTYAADRQAILDEMLLQVARLMPERRFVVAGPQYPAGIAWPGNVERRDHVAPGEHRAFYARQRFTLNLTRADMRRAGHSPSIRLFEAAACGVAVISDAWPGLQDFFAPGRELIVASSRDDVVCALKETDEEQRRRIGMAARARVLGSHTAAHRAEALEAYVDEVLAGAPREVRA